MSKVVYLLITDLHDYYSMAGRYNYADEILHVRTKIIQIVNKYNELGYTVKLIFLGDIFLRSYRQVGNALEASSFYNTLNSYVSGIYTVVGNHEFTYRNNNPFWYMIAETDTNIRLHDRGATPKGFSNVFNVVDVLKDGDTTFYFNHYGERSIIPINEDGVSIGLYHKDMLHPKALAFTRAMGNERDYNYVKVEENSEYTWYDYSFYGHLHTIYAELTFKYGIDKVSTCQWLGSLGRTNHTEVDDTFLERDIPAVIIDDGKFQRIEHNTFDLMSRKDCVKEDIVKKVKDKRVKLKETKEFLNKFDLQETPILSVKSKFNNEAFNAVIDGILDGSGDVYYKELMEEIDKWRI